MLNIICMRVYHIFLATLIRINVSWSGTGQMIRIVPDPKHVYLVTELQWLCFITRAFIDFFPGIFYNVLWAVILKLMYKDIFYSRSGATSATALTPSSPPRRRSPSGSRPRSWPAGSPPRTAGSTNRFTQTRREGSSNRSSSSASWSYHWSKSTPTLVYSRICLQNNQNVELLALYAQSF